jgi:hypothetical protein
MYPNDTMFDPITKLEPGKNNPNYHSANNGYPYKQIRDSVPLRAISNELLFHPSLYQLVNLERRKVWVWIQAAAIRWAIREKAGIATSRRAGGQVFTIRAGAGSRLASYQVVEWLRISAFSGRWFVSESWFLSWMYKVILFRDKSSVNGLLYESEYRVWNVSAT